MSLENARIILTAACNKWIAAGGKIAPGAFKAEAARCPLGALLSDADYNSPGEPSFRGHATSRLQCTLPQTFAFTFGFDGFPHFPGADTAWYALGKEFRRNYVKKA